jgi:hypothetical protein
MCSDGTINSRTPPYSSGSQVNLESFHSCYQKNEKNRKWVAFFLNHRQFTWAVFFIPSGNFQRGGLVCQKMKNNYMISGTHLAFACNLCNRLREERETEKQLLGKQLTEYSHARPRRWWWGSGSLNPIPTREKRKTEIEFIRQHTHKKVPGLPQFSQFI